ncbi:MAG TPA: ABC transporter permease, partial [Crenalkalicoccus sp.]|nr:ABC transporter permease [Crenalkalicoccus sp.]
RVQLPLAALAAVALAWLPFLKHARNRLLSGQPIGLAGAVEAAGALPTAALAMAGALLLVPVLRPGHVWARWAGLAGAGMTVAAALGVAGAASTTLAASGSGSARTSLAGGAWLLIGVVLLMASDLSRRLQLSRLGAVAAAAVVIGPPVALMASGALRNMSLALELGAQRDAFLAALEQHVFLVLGALVPALLAGLPLGVAAQRVAGVRRVAFPVLNLIQTVPSIALFGLLIGPLSALAGAAPWLGRLGVAGVGPAPAILALVLYSLLPIVRNTVEGLDGVPRAVRDAARGMGMTGRQAFWQVEAWLALPVVLSGLRITAVQAVGLAAVSALIGAGGFGAIIFQGLFANALDLVLLGTLPVIALAVAVDALFRALAGLARGAIGADS